MHRQRQRRRIAALPEAKEPKTSSLSAEEITRRQSRFISELNRNIAPFKEYIPFHLMPSHPYPEEEEENEEEKEKDQGQEGNRKKPLEIDDLDPDEANIPSRQSRPDLRTVPIPTPLMNLLKPSSRSQNESKRRQSHEGQEEEDHRFDSEEKQERRHAEWIKQKELEKIAAAQKSAGVSDDRDKERAAARSRALGAEEAHETRIRQTTIHEFLRTPCPRTIDEALRTFLAPPPPPVGFRPTPGKRFMFQLPRQILFRRCMPLTALKIQQIWKDPQKSDLWLKARSIRNTGSTGGSVIEWNPYETCLGRALSSVYGEFRDNPATVHGNTYEKPAAKHYLIEFQKQLNYLYVQQRGYETGHIVFRGKTIPLERSTTNPKRFKAPHARIYNIAMKVDPLGQWRGVSIDGLVAINGIATHLLEIKCPWAGGHMFLYVLEPQYYYTQSQDNLYTMRRYFPSLGSCDRITYSPIPKFGMIVDTHVLDASWYLLWYAPRVMRYFFGQFRSVMTFTGRLTESAVYRFAQKHPELGGKIDGKLFGQFVEETYRR